MSRKWENKTSVLKLRLGEEMQHQINGGVNVSHYGKTYNENDDIMASMKFSLQNMRLEIRKNIYFLISPAIF